MNELLSTQNLVQAGSTIIALTLVYSLLKIVFNHEKHFSDVMIKNTEALIKLKELIERLKKIK